MQQGRRHSRVFRLPGEDGVRHLSLGDQEVGISGEVEESLFYGFTPGGVRYSHDGRIWRSRFTDPEAARGEFRRQVESLVVQGATEMVFDGRQYIPRPRPRHREDQEVRLHIGRFRDEVQRAIAAVRQDPLFASANTGPLEACFAEQHLRDGYLTFLQRQPPKAGRGVPYGTHASLYCALLAAQRTLGGRLRGVRRHRGRLKLGPREALFHHGDLIVSGDAELEGALAVTGNVQVEGTIVARHSAAKILSLGHLSAERMVSSGAVVVGGNLLLGTLLYVFDRQQPFRVRQRIQSPLLLEHGCDLLALRGLRGERIDVASREGRRQLELRGVVKKAQAGAGLASQLARSAA